MDSILLGKFLLPLLYGVVENRLFKEHGEAVVLNHFKLYHIWLFILFAINAVTKSFWLSMLLLVYAPLALDVAWWLIRWIDFQRDPVKAAESYGESNAWHSRGDWDNYGELPLVFGCYWWWWLLGGILAMLGVLML